MTKNPEEGEATDRSLDTPPPPPPAPAESPSSERPGQPTDHPSPPAALQESKSANDHTEPENSSSPTPPLNPSAANGEESNKDLEETNQQEEREQREEGDGEGEEVETTDKEEAEEEGEEVQKEEEDKEVDHPKADEERQEEQPEELKGETLEEENIKEQEEEEEVKEGETKEREEQEEEQDQTKEGEKQEKEEKGDDSQISGTDVSSMDGKGDSTEVSPRRETSDLNDTASADLKTMENKNELTPDCTASEAMANSGAAGDGADMQLPSSEAAPGTEEASASAPATVNGPEDTGDRAAPATENSSDTPAPVYEDDFSEVSEASDRGAVLTADANSVDAAADKAKPQNSKSPTPSSNEEARAERGTVVPIPASAQKKSDGRSFVEEGGERRGQDRSEVPCEEGVDSRGQGQWKSEEEEQQLFLQSSLTNQQAEKEAMQAVIDDKVKIQREFDELKGHYMQLEEKSRRWDEDTSTLKQACQEQNARIRELEDEQTRLRHFEQWGKDNESKIKDLQDRLGALAGEDAEKDRRIQKLQEELQDTKSRLVTAERQVAVNNEATQLRSAQQSKTCTIL